MVASRSSPRWPSHSGATCVASPRQLVGEREGSAAGIAGAAQRQLNPAIDRRGASRFLASDSANDVVASIACRHFSQRGRSCSCRSGPRDSGPARAVPAPLGIHAGVNRLLIDHAPQPARRGAPVVPLAIVELAGPAAVEFGVGFAGHFDPYQESASLSAIRRNSVSRVAA